MVTVTYDDLEVDFPNDWTIRNKKFAGMHWFLSILLAAVGATMAAGSSFATTGPSRGRRTFEGRPIRCGGLVPAAGYDHSVALSHASVSSSVEG